MHTKKFTVADTECAYGWMTSHPVQGVHILQYIQYILLYVSTSAYPNSNYSK